MDYSDMIEGFDEEYELNWVIECAKEMLDITHSNDEMTDDEIREVARLIGGLADDTTFDDERQFVYGHKGIDLMLTVVLYAFPLFWEKYELAQFN